MAPASHIMNDQVRGNSKVAGRKTSSSQRQDRKSTGEKDKYKKSFTLQQVQPILIEEKLKQKAHHQYGQQPGAQLYETTKSGNTIHSYPINNATVTNTCPVNDKHDKKRQALSISTTKSVNKSSMGQTSSGPYSKVQNLHYYDNEQFSNNNQNFNESNIQQQHQKYQEYQQQDGDDEIIVVEEEDDEEVQLPNFLGRIDMNHPQSKDQFYMTQIINPSHGSLYAPLKDYYGGKNDNMIMMNNNSNTNTNTTNSTAAKPKRTTTQQQVRNNSSKSLNKKVTSSSGNRSQNATMIQNLQKQILQKQKIQMQLECSPTSNYSEFGIVNSNGGQTVKGRSLLNRSALQIAQARENLNATAPINFQHINDGQLSGSCMNAATAGMSQKKQQLQEYESLINRNNSKENWKEQNNIYLNSNSNFQLNNNKGIYSLSKQNMLQSVKSCASPSKYNFKNSAPISNHNSNNNNQQPQSKEQSQTRQFLNLALQKLILQQKASNQPQTQTQIYNNQAILISQNSNMKSNGSNNFRQSSTMNGEQMSQVLARNNTSSSKQPAILKLDQNGQQSGIGLNTVNNNGGNYNQTQSAVCKVQRKLNKTVDSASKQKQYQYQQQQQPKQQSSSKRSSMNNTQINNYTNFMGGSQTIQKGVADNLNNTTYHNIRGSNKFSNTMKFADFNQTCVIDARHNGTVGSSSTITGHISKKPQQHQQQQSRISLKSTQNINFQEDVMRKQPASIQSTYSTNTAVTTTTNNQKKKFASNMSGCGAGVNGGPASKLNYGTGEIPVQLMQAKNMSLNKQQKHKKQSSKDMGIDNGMVNSILNMYQNEMVQQLNDEIQSKKMGLLLNTGVVGKHKEHNKLNQYIQQSSEIQQRSANNGKTQSQNKRDSNISSNLNNPVTVNNAAEGSLDDSEAVQNYQQYSKKVNSNNLTGFNNYSNNNSNSNTTPTMDQQQQQIPNLNTQYYNQVKINNSNKNAQNQKSKRTKVKEIQNRTQPLPRTLIDMAKNAAAEAMNMSTGEQASAGANSGTTQSNITSGAINNKRKLVGKTSSSNGNETQAKGKNISNAHQKQPQCTTNQADNANAKSKDNQMRQKPKIGNKNVAIDGTQLVTTKAQNQKQQLAQPKQPKEERESQQDNQKIDSQKRNNFTILDSSENEENESDSINEKCKLDGFVLGKQIGEGAYAVVRVATCSSDGKQYAIKVYDKSKLGDTNRQRSVRREIKLLQKMNHPNIVKIHQAFETDDNVYLVMDYVSGGSLHSYLKEQGSRRLEEREAKRIVGQMLTALQYCHRKSIAHRDIKLENILLDEQRNLKLIDFGFSTCIPNDKKIKMFCGTPSYMAPEIVNRWEYAGPPADIWASAVLLYALINGCFPFRGQTDKDLYRRITRGTYVMHNQALSEEFLNFLQRMMHVDADTRPSAEELLQDPWFQIDCSTQTKEQKMAEAKRQFKNKILAKVSVQVEKKQNTICLMPQGEKQNFKLIASNTAVLGQKGGANNLNNKNNNDFSDYGIQQANNSKKLNQEAYQAYYNTSGSGTNQNNYQQQMQQNPYYNNFFTGSFLDGIQQQANMQFYPPPPPLPGNSGFSQNAPNNNNINLNIRTSPSRFAPIQQQNQNNGMPYPMLYSSNIGQNQLNQVGTPQVIYSPAGGFQCNGGLINNNFNIINNITQVVPAPTVVATVIPEPVTKVGAPTAEKANKQETVKEQQQQQYDSSSGKHNALYGIKDCDLDEEILSSIVNMGGYQRSHVVSQLEQETSHITHLYTRLKEEKLSQTHGRPLSMQPAHSRRPNKQHNHGIYPNANGVSIPAQAEQQFEEITLHNQNNKNNNNGVTMMHLIDSTSKTESDSENPIQL